MIAVPLRGRADGRSPSPAEMMSRLGVTSGREEHQLSSLPFVLDDATCGTENELQAVVSGSREKIDLPRIIEESNYFQNIIKRRRRGEVPKRVLSDLEGWLAGNRDNTWENSWVRFPRRRLSVLGDKVLERDLLADKACPESDRRGDADQFLLREEGEDCLRIPVSYLLKLALADAMGVQDRAPAWLKEAGLKLAGHFLSDNTSPETYSLHVVPLRMESGQGRAVADESAQRFLLSQLLVQYAGTRFGLTESGQRVLVYMAPHPPIRQKELNDCITDSFYRELFMNPCLSGWDKGEEKHRYMHLCHQVMSRAQLNSLARLKEAGIINSNLVVMPSTSNISLANNGVHISLGSRKLTEALADPASGFTAGHEKYLGDLVIKTVEHFLPLFVGTYSAAPYRLDFADFHPEKVLSFLPYQLDYTHLRMIWRRWKKKADLKIKGLGLRLTPFGPPWLDSALSRAFALRGDFVPDFRLIDYLVALMSTDQSPALDGREGNQQRLKKDLAELGVFDPSMSTYLPYRQREFSKMGFSGFEGRYYSLFAGLRRDLAPAAELQCLVTALACRLIAAGRLTHGHIPDSPETESERRQIFFGAAIGLPTFFVKADTGNLFLRLILEKTGGVRASRRYPGYLRVGHPEFRAALFDYICREAADLIEAMGLERTVQDLRWRLERPEHRSVHERLTRGVLSEMGVKDPLKAQARDFNLAAESYYRETLRRQHMEEAWDVLEEDLSGREFLYSLSNAGFREAAEHTLDGRNGLEYVQSLRGLVLREEASEEDMLRLINLVILTVKARERRAEELTSQNGRYEGEDETGDSPVRRAALR